ncbi:hypothetical protein QYM36_001309 [Artemia franciscana]|uniref:Uncharacterized protein n=1 Tax=Artemia franciscana TaxID=6661 RepID=A0AA88IA88_ARTSF|nr:hypothetical protein QYM36_001309 [Artemia franciscana]
MKGLPEEQKDCLNVGHNASLGNGNLRQELVQFFVISNGKLKVTRNYTSFLLSRAALPASSRAIASKQPNTPSLLQGKWVPLHQLALHSCSFSEDGESFLLTACFDDARSVTPGNEDDLLESIDFEQISDDELENDVLLEPSIDPMDVDWKSLYTAKLVQEAKPTPSRQRW